MHVYFATLLSTGNSGSLFRRNPEIKTDGSYLFTYDAENKIALGTVYLLEPFTALHEWMIPYITIFKSFMMDSGAYSFMRGQDASGVNWEDFVTQYCEAIAKYRPNHFFELDIDQVVGLPKVEKLRAFIEKKAGRQCIPVWHFSRGKDYFLQLCKDYDYIAIGGLAADKSYKHKIEQFLPWFIDTAGKHNCKIHGLGYTPNKLRQHSFDSVDSTSWIRGNRFKCIEQFKRGKIKLLTDFLPKQYGETDNQYLVYYNLRVWLKFIDFLRAKHI